MSVLSGARSFLAGFGLRRFLTHLVLLGLSVVAVWLAQQYAPRAEAAYLFSLAFGYLSVILIALTLLIGPLNLLRQRRNPVNINLRRDVGIWAGITGCLHVVFALQLHAQGQILYYFFQPGEDGTIRPLLTRFGISNYFGAAATVILVALLLTSNMLSLRRLKGKRWKALQRLNYVLAVLALIHTLLFQGSSQRGSFFMDSLVLLSTGVLVAQGVGRMVYRKRVKARDFKNPCTM